MNLPLKHREPRGHRDRFGFWYVALICSVSFATALLMREPRRASMFDDAGARP